jgi:hypothetical protein
MQILVTGVSAYKASSVRVLEAVAESVYVSVLFMVDARTKHG